MKKQFLHVLRGPVSRKLQLLLFLLICLYVFQQALTTFGYNPYIENDIVLQSGSYYPSANAVIEDKNVKDRQKWNKIDAEDVLNKWKNQAQQLTNGITANIETTVPDVAITTSKNVKSNSKDRSKISHPLAPTSKAGNQLLEQNTPKHTPIFSTAKPPDVSPENKREYRKNTNHKKNDSLEKQSKEQNVLSFPMNNINNDSLNTSTLVIQRNDKHDIKKQPSSNIGYEPSNENDDSQTSHSIPPELNFSTGIKCKEKSSDPRFEMRGTNYWALYNYIPAEESFKCNETITYTTHGELTFLHNLAPLLRRWQGPVSIAVYTPGSDYLAAVEAAFFYRQCDKSIFDTFDDGTAKKGNGSANDEEMSNQNNTAHGNKELTGSELVRKFVTFHFFFPVGQHHPAAGTPLLTRENGLLDYQANCDKQPPNANGMRYPGSEYPTKPFISYRSTNNLTYPVNVGRNIARQSATSHFVFPSDIELYPSPGIIPRFLKMISRQNSKQNKANASDNIDVQNNQTVISQPKRIVYVNAIFELQDGSKLPNTKLELVKLLKTKKAIPFHKWVCPVCHTIPKFEMWQHTDLMADEMRVTNIGKRHPPFQHWEPIYIGTNDEPLYDERLSWEGRADKMTQGYAMCVLDYDFAILNNAFLIHRPGIKLAKQAKALPQHSRTQQAMINNVIMPELKRLYGTRKGCSV